MQYGYPRTYRGPGGLRLWRRDVEAAASDLQPFLTGQIIAHSNERKTAGFLAQSFLTRAGLLLRMKGRLELGTDAAVFLLDQEHQPNHAFTVRPIIRECEPLGFLTLNPRGIPMRERPDVSAAFDVGMGASWWAQPMPWSAARREAKTIERSDRASSC